MLSITEYLDGVDRTLQALPGILAEWDTLSEDLCAAYIETVEWQLRIRTEVVCQPVNLLEGLRPYADEVRAKMGIRLEDYGLRHD